MLSMFVCISLQLLIVGFMYNMLSMYLPPVVDSRIHVQYVIYVCLYLPPVVDSRIHVQYVIYVCLYLPPLYELYSRYLLRGRNCIVVSNTS